MTEEIETYSYEAKLIDGVPSLSDLDIELIIHKDVKRRHQPTKESILENLETLRNIYIEHNKPKTVISTDHAPCMGLDGKCGSTEFLRTGTCFVCLNCSTSQGCS